MNKEMLTKDDLISRFKIGFVSEDGKVIKTTEGKILKQSLTKNGYLNITRYDTENRIKVPKKNKKGYVYRPTPIGVHRIVWIWYKGFQPKDLDIDHINGDKTDNKIENLQLLDRSTNIVKSRGENYGKNPYAKMAKKKVYSLEYIEERIAFFETKQYIIRTTLTGKERADADHKVRSPLYQWKNRKKQFLKEIYEKNQQN